MIILPTGGVWNVTNGRLLRVQSHFPDDQQPITIAGVHRIGRFGGKVDGDPLANAYLISAAPDLYGALKFILAFYEPGQTYLDTEAWKVAHAGALRAMRKAKGEL